MRAHAWQFGNCEFSPSAVFFCRENAGKIHFEGFICGGVGFWPQIAGFSDFGENVGERSILPPPWRHGRSTIRWANILGLRRCQVSPRLIYFESFRDFLFLEMFFEAFLGFSRGLGCGADVAIDLGGKYWCLEFAAAHIVPQFDKLIFQQWGHRGDVAIFLITFLALALVFRRISGDKMWFFGGFAIKEYMRGRNVATLYFVANGIFGFHLAIISPLHCVANARTMIHFICRTNFVISNVCSFSMNVFLTKYRKNIRIEKQQ